MMGVLTWDCHGEWLETQGGEEHEKTGRPRLERCSHKPWDVGNHQKMVRQEMLTPKPSERAWLQGTLTPEFQPSEP